MGAIEQELHRGAGRSRGPRLPELSAWIVKRSHGLVQRRNVGALQNRQARKIRNRRNSSKSLAIKWNPCRSCEGLLKVLLDIRPETRGLPILRSAQKEVTRT